MKTNQYVVLFAISCLLTVVGCSGFVPLSGKVTYSDNGEPVPCGMVMLESAKFMSRGTINKDGTFTVGSLNEKDGIPVGEYRVYIVGAMESREDQSKKKTGPEGMVMAAPMSITYLLDRKYEQASTSGLTFTVDGSKKPFNISVDRYK